MKRAMRYAAALGAGLVLGLAAPPTDAYGALWLGVVLLAWVLEMGAGANPGASSRRGRGLLRGAMRGLLFGVGANLVVLRFMPAVVLRFTELGVLAAAAGMLLVALLEGVRWMVAGVGASLLARARVPRPVALAAGVYAGTFVPTMLPWTIAGLLSPWPSMLQLADVVGERGVAALMALTAGLLAVGLPAMLERSTRRHGARALAGAAAILVAQAGYGDLRMRSVERARGEAPHARVGLVQPSTNAIARWDESRGPAILRELTTLTTREEAKGVDFVVWPETAYPYRLPHDVRQSPPGARAVLQPAVRGPVITGLQMSGLDDVIYNSVAVASPGGALSEPYDKRHLLWFGETVPLADEIPWLRRTFARGLGLVPGDRDPPLVAGPARAAALVCYEDMLPAAGREAMAAQPNLLVNVTNDAWFEGTTEPELHLRVAVPRSIELRRDMVRAVNLGPTAWVDAAGRVRARTTELQVLPSTLGAAPALLTDAPTLYARFGDAPWALLALLLANAAVWRARRRRSADGVVYLASPPPPVGPPAHPRSRTT